MRGWAYLSNEPSKSIPLLEFKCAGPALLVNFDQMFILCTVSVHSQYSLCTVSVQFRPRTFENQSSSESQEVI